MNSSTCSREIQFLVLQNSSKVTFTMQGANPVLADCSDVARGTVSFVPGEAIDGVIDRFLDHQAVSGHLGNNGPRGNGRFCLISTDDGLMRERKMKIVASINDELMNLGF